MVKPATKLVILLHLLMIIVALTIGYLVGANDNHDKVAPSEMTTLTSEYRRSQGLNALTENARLNTSAQEKAETLCRTGDWSHEAGHELFFKAIDRAGYNYSKSGENLAKGYNSPKEAFAALLKSPTHHENIVGEYKEMGVGYSYCEGKKYYVIHYGRV